MGILKCQDCGCELEPEDTDLETGRKTALCPECWEKMEEIQKVDEDEQDQEAEG